MNTELPRRDTCDERQNFALPAEQKRRIFEIAAHENISVSAFIRQAIARATSDAGNGAATV